MRFSALLTAALVGGISTDLRADELRVLGEEINTAHELAHVVRGEVGADRATLRITRTVRNSGKNRATLVLIVDRSIEAALTELVVQSRGTVEAQELSDAEVAIVFEDVPPRAERTVAYTLEMPVERIGGDTGRIWLTEAGAPNLTDPVLRIGGLPAKPTPQGVTDLYDVRAPAPERGRARYGVFALPSRTIWRGEIDAPKRLGEARDQATVVFVVDGSHSQGQRGIARQRRLMAAWTERMPNAQYEIILYDRVAERLFGRFVPSSKMPNMLRPTARIWEPQNGSNLDAAIRTAVDAARTAKGAIYVVGCSDDLLPQKLTPKRLARAFDGLPKNAVVHILLSDGVRESGAIEQRQDRHPLSPIAAAHGGMVMRVTLLEDYPNAERVALTNLIRPMRIDELTITLDGERVQGWGTERFLIEGEDYSPMGLLESAPQQVVVTGKVWARPWRVVAERSDAVSRRAGIHVFGDPDLAEQLTAEEIRHLGRKAGIVTRFTAFRGNRRKVELVAPTDYGLEPARGLRGVGIGGSGRKPEPPHALDSKLLLATFESIIRQCTASYTGPATSVLVDIETTGREIVAIDLLGANEETQACLREAMWKTTLDERFSHRRGRGSLSIDMAEGQRPGQGPPSIADQAVTHCTCGPNGVPPVPLSWLVLISIRFRRRA